MSLFASGFAPIILQIKTWGLVGYSLLSIQGTSFNFVSLLIMGSLALKNGGAEVPTMMTALFSTLMIARLLHRDPAVKGAIIWHAASLLHWYPASW